MVANFVAGLRQGPGNLPQEKGSLMDDTSQRGRPHYRTERLSIPSQGVAMASKLYIPLDVELGAAPPVVVILGPIGSVKEQSPIQYATRLARDGVAALIFDPRCHGESGGEPRRFESGQMKADDFVAAVDFLALRDDLDPNRVYALGICQGVNWVVKAALQDKRIKRLAMVSGHYLYRDSLERFFKVSDFQDASLFHKRIEGGRVSLAKFQTTGEADYIPIVGTASDRLLPNSTTADYYLPWENSKPQFAYRGRWENRVTKMSEHEIWTTEIDKALMGISIPTLMLSGEASATPAAMLPGLFAKLGVKEKQLCILPGKQHLQFYDDSETIDEAVAVLVQWYAAASN
jgi:fermentation-respiration switch protein FrsA (DUF1100 family)